MINQQRGLGGGGAGGANLRTGQLVLIIVVSSLVSSLVTTMTQSAFSVGSGSATTTRSGSPPFAFEHRGGRRDAKSGQTSSSSSTSSSTCAAMTKEIASLRSAIAAVPSARDVESAIQRAVDNGGLKPASQPCVCGNGNSNAATQGAAVDVNVNGANRAVTTSNTSPNTIGGGGASTVVATRNGDASSAVDRVFPGPLFCMGRGLPVPFALIPFAPRTEAERGEIVRVRRAEVVRTKTTVPFSMYIYPKGEDMFVSESIRHWGLWDEAILRFVEGILKHFDSQRDEHIVVDIGGNIGFFTHCALSMQYRTVTFEPLISNIELLTSTIGLNEWGARSTVYHNAVSFRTESLSLQSEASNRGGTHVGGELSEGTYGLDYVQTVVVSDLPPATFPGRIVLLKVDVEGFEMDVFQGASTIIADPARRPRYILVEFSKDSQARSACVVNKFAEFLVVQGYRMYCVDKRVEFPISSLSKRTGNYLLVASGEIWPVPEFVPFRPNK